MSNYTHIQTEVTPTSVTLDNGTVLPCGMVVWSTGLAPRDFTKSLPMDRNQQGQLIVNSHLQVIGDPHGRVYALGDCAQVLHHPTPCTAQAAERQGRYLGKALSHRATPTQPEPKPFVFKPWGMLAYVGGYKALHDTPIGKGEGIIIHAYNYASLICLSLIPEDAGLSKINKITTYLSYLTEW